MNGDKLDPRSLRNIVSYLAGIGVELLLTTAIVGIGVAIVAALGLAIR